MSNTESIYKVIYGIESAIYREFALESKANIHIVSFDSRNPLLSTLKIFISDIASVQIGNAHLPDFSVRVLPLRLVLIDQIRRLHACICLKDNCNIHEMITTKEITQPGDSKKFVDAVREKIFNQENYLRDLSNYYTEKDQAIEYYPERNVDGSYLAFFELDSEDFQEDSEEDKIRYSLEVSYLPVLRSKLHQESSPAELKTILDSFLLKLFVLALNTKRKKILIEKIQRQSLKSIIAVIMARNMSHTDGSHLMIEFNKYVQSLEARSIHDLKYQFELYNNHLRNVMELVADVSGGIGSQSLFTVDFSEFVEDLQSNYFSSFVQKGNRKILRSNFLGSGLNDGKAHSILSLSEQLRNKIVVAFPGGKNGSTAFLIILKNIFRNLYKHSKPRIIEFYDSSKKAYKKSSYYELELDLEDDLDPEHYSVRVVEKTNSYPPNKINRILSRIQQHFNDKIIGQSDHIKYDGWGLLEMKICAAYLISASLHEIEFIKPENRVVVV